MRLGKLRASLGAVKEIAVLRLQGVPMPPVAPRLGRTGVFIGASNSAGQGWAWARALEAARPDLKAVSARFENARDTNSWASFSVDLPIYSRYAAHSRTWQRLQFEALREYRGVIIESGDGVLARFFGNDPAEQARRLQSAGVRVALFFHGSDIRSPDRHLRAEEHSHFSTDAEFTEVFRELTSRNRRLADELGVPVFVATVELLDEVPGSTWVPISVDVERWSRADAPIRDHGPLRVSHMPSNHMVKGTALIEPLLRRLADEGSIDYRALQGVPHSEMPEVYGGADVVIDQFRVGNYGTAAIEAMAAGRIVVSHVSERVRTLTHEITGEVLPIVEANPETLGSILADIQNNPAPYLELAARGPGFVRRHHDGRRAGEVLAAWLEQAP